MVSPACRRCRLSENPGVVLGAILGAAASSDATRSRSSLRRGFSQLGAWLEQLHRRVDRQGREGIHPDRPRGARPARQLRRRPPIRLSPSRVRAGSRRKTSAPTRSQRAGHPVVRIALDDPYDLGQEFFRWEIATAVAGSILGIHPFDQPDVEASKTATQQLTAEYEKTGSLPTETPFFAADGIRLYTDQANAAALAALGGTIRWRLSSRRTSTGSARATISPCSPTWR